MRYRFLSAAAVSAVLLSGCGSASGVQATQTAQLAQTAQIAQAPLAASALHEYAATRIAASAASAIQVPEQVEASDIAAALYCQHTGGSVEIRRAVYGTNGPNPLPLANFRAFCQYTAADTSRIHILLSSLYTTQPTLAVLAYIGAPKWGRARGIRRHAIARCSAVRISSEGRLPPAADGSRRTRSTRSSKRASSPTCLPSTRGAWPITPPALSAASTSRKSCDSNCLDRLTFIATWR